MDRRGYYFTAEDMKGEEKMPAFFKIDADTHISPLNEPVSFRVESLIEEMDRSGIDKSVVWIQPPYMREIDSSLDYIYESVQKYRGRLIGFGWANPHLGMEKSKEHIRKSLVDYQLYGVKLNGAQDSHYIDDEKTAFPLIEEIAKYGGALCLHVGVDAYDFTHPFRVAKVARRYPEMPILLAHMGGVGAPDVSSACVEVAQECGNVFLIGSQIGYFPVLKAIKTLGASRVCYGSDMPYNSMRACFAAYQALLKDEVSEEDAQLVLGGNIQNLFGLK